MRVIRKRSTVVMAMARDPQNGHIYCIRLRPTDLDRNVVADRSVLLTFDMISRGAIKVSTARKLLDYLEQLEKES